MDIEIRTEASLCTTIEGRRYMLLLPPAAPGSEIYSALQAFMDRITEIASSQIASEGVVDEKGNDIPASAD